MNRVVFAIILLLAIYGVGVTWYLYVKQTAATAQRNALCMELDRALGQLTNERAAVDALRTKIKEVQNARANIPPPVPAKDILDVAHDLDNLNAEIERRR